MEQLTIFHEIISSTRIIKLAEHCGLTWVPLRGYLKNLENNSVCKPTLNWEMIFQIAASLKMKELHKLKSLELDQAFFKIEQYAYNNKQNNDEYPISKE